MRVDLSCQMSMKQPTDQTQRSYAYDRNLKCESVSWWEHFVCCVRREGVLFFVNIGDSLCLFFLGWEV